MQISNSQCSLSKRHAWRLKRQWVNLSQGWLAHICSKQFSFSWLMGKLSLSLLHSLLSQATLPIVCQSYVHHRTARSHTQSGCYFNENYAESSSLIALIKSGYDIFYLGWCLHTHTIVWLLWSMCCKERF